MARGGVEAKLFARKARRREERESVKEQIG
jgi:hypothetical protein